MEICKNNQSSDKNTVKPNAIFDAISLYIPTRCLSDPYLHTAWQTSQPLTVEPTTHAHIHSHIKTSVPTTYFT
jgi:hypothetical protein